MPYFSRAAACSIFSCNVWPSLSNRRAHRFAFDYWSAAQIPSEKCHEPPYKIAACLCLLVVIASSVGAPAPSGYAVHAPAHDEAASRRRGASAAPQYWYDPMHPSEHFDKPGKSPFMDMQLVPKYADGADQPRPGGAHPAVHRDRSARCAEPRSASRDRSSRGSFARVVDTVGLVAVDEHRIEAIQVRQPGWVERLDVRAVGDSVRRGQLLAGVYSPDLLATQQELLIARNSNDPSSIEAARRRLALFGLSGAQIAHIEKTGQVERRVDYYAPFDGYVMELGVRQGAAVQPGATLFQLADLSSVWINAEVPETQAAWIKTG